MKQNEELEHKIREIESENKEYLEELAVELIKKEFGIPEGALQFDAKLTKPGDIDSEGFKQQGEQPSEEEVEDNILTLEDVEFGASVSEAVAIKQGSVNNFILKNFN